MIRKIEYWLTNPKRDYAFGLEVFNKFSDNETKVKFGIFLNSPTDCNDPKQTVIHFPQLIHRVNLIYSKIMNNPEAYKDLLTEQQINPISEAVGRIVSLQKEVSNLQGKIETLESGTDENATDISILVADLNEGKSEIENLKKYLSDNKIVVLDPKDLKGKCSELYKRNKEITPLMASLHAELITEGLLSEKRKDIANQLCSLDDERRNNWNQIDDFLQNGNSALIEDRELSYSDDPLVKGMQIGKRIDRLKENIKKANDALVKHQKSGKQNLVAKAEMRISEYNLELANLQKEVNEKG